MVGMSRGIASWLAVFVVGFVIGYGLMSLAVDMPAEAGPPTASEPGDAVAADALAESAALSAVASADQLIDQPIVPSDPSAVHPQIDAPAVPTAPTPPPEPKAAWDACNGQRCILDFGILKGGLSVRAGKVEHGSTVDWQRDFSQGKKLDILPIKRNFVVDVRGVGLDDIGQPLAVEIGYTKEGKKRVGVVSLQPGDKTLTLRPVGKR